MPVSLHSVRPQGRGATRAASHAAVGQRLLAAGDSRRGLAAYVAAAQATPHDPAIHVSLCTLLNDLGEHEAAVGAGFTAIGLDARDPRAQGELGRALYLSGRADAAMRFCARAVVLAPRNVGALINFGAVLYTLGRFDQALAAARDAVALAPSHVQARSNLALALEATGACAEAEVEARRALALDPESPPLQHNLAALLLSGGALGAEAWALYEGRFGLSPVARQIGAVPRWAGEDVRGRTVLVHAEQGAGDTIQFARYLPMLAERGARVVFAVDRSLLRLMALIDGVDQLVEAGQALPRFDVFCPVASLPAAFGTMLESIPAGIPYLPCSGKPAPGRLRVGLAWAGNPAFVHDRLRSIDDVAIRALDGIEGVEFHNLQKGKAPPFPMQDRMPDAADFADTAAIIAGLDVVVAVDTAVAHLAGAMGKEVLLMNRFMGCWRWLRGRADSPWYPTVEVLRQPAPGGWHPVLEQVRSRLAERVASRMTMDGEPGHQNH